MIRWVERLRRPILDRQKAQALGEEQTGAVFRSAVGNYDDFVDVARHVSDPVFLVGTAQDSRGNPISVRLPREALAAHWLIQGATGMGKSSFAILLVMSAVAHGLPICTVDCKAGFFEATLRWVGALVYRMAASARAAFLARLAVFNPFGECLPPFNCCALRPNYSPEVQAYEVTSVLSRLFDVGLSVHMESICRATILLLTLSGLTLAEAPLVLQDELLRGILVERSGSSVLKDFFFHTHPLLPRISTDALIGRFSSLLLAEPLRLMFGADDTVDFLEIILRGDPLFIRLAKGHGIPEEQVNIVGALTLQSLLQASYASGASHAPYLVVIDELFHLLASSGHLADRFATGLAALRAYRVHLALLGHDFSQVPSALRDALVTHCDYVAMFRSSLASSRLLGDFLPEVAPELVLDALSSGRPLPGPREMHRQISEGLQRLPAQTMYWYDRRQPYPAVRVRVPDVPEPHESIGLTTQAFDAFIEEQRVDVGAVALPKDVLRAQLAARQERLRSLTNPPLRVASSTSPRADTAQPPSPARSRRRSKPQLG